MSANQDNSAPNKWHFQIGERPPSVAMIEAIAFVTNQDPLDIDPVADVIDPDAMDQLLGGDDTVTISFVFEEYDIELSGSGEIVISGTDLLHTDLPSANEEVAKLRLQLTHLSLSELEDGGLVVLDRNENVVRKGENFDPTLINQRGD
ncbi:HalOD1 output domain-containing protein [Halobellus sp. GM3]|uniref:HalOD1 output domain-containing protein n=1 Tax=Halobellus sp. GM3 TaxID=3458410 RepID=UPI00403D7124